MLHTSNIIECDERESWRASRLLQVNFSDPSVFIKQIVELSLSDINWKVADVHTSHCLR